MSAEFKSGVVIKKRKAVQVKLPYTEGRLVRDHALYQIWISPPYPTWSRGKDWNITDFTMAECTVVVKKGTLMSGSWVWFMSEQGNQSMISPVVTMEYGTKGTMAWLRAKSQNGGSLAAWGCGIRSGTIRILPPEGPAEEFSLQTNPTVESLIQARWKSANADGQWTI